MDDGIYFGLDADVYHAIPRLSPSSIKDLRISPATFWANSFLNPHPKELTDEQQRRHEMAKVLGTAYHCARLEPDQFHERFVRQLDEADFAGVEGFVKGGTAYGKALGEIPLPDSDKCHPKSKAGESVAEQARRLLAAGYSKGPIWDVELAKWEAERGERMAIPAVAWDEIQQDMDRIRRVPEIHALLSDGFAEVSILWTCPETGLPMKTRLDYLRTDGWADFKTFANSNGKHVLNAIRDSFMYNRYHVQGAVQRDAVLAIKAQLLPAYGQTPARTPTGPQMDVVEGIMAAADPVCHFIWQEKGGIPNLWARKLRFVGQTASEAVAQLEADGASAEHLERARKFAEMAGHEATPSAWYARALREVATAKRDFALYSQVYPQGEPWMPFDPVGELSDLDFGKYWLEETN